MIEQEMIKNTINECINDINKKKKELEKEKEYGWAVHKELANLVFKTKEEQELQNKLLQKLSCVLLSK